MATIGAPSWEPQRLLAEPILGSVHAQIAALSHHDFPDFAALNNRAEGIGIRSRSGAGLRFVAPRAAIASIDRSYEARIYLDGEIDTRPGSWHDLFNALAWLSFPQTKAMLNARHYELMAYRAPGAVRGTARDVLTLFDEGGILVAAACEELAALLAGEQWKELFWRRRTEVARLMRFYVFGHSIMEKALSPYRGITAKALVVPVDDAFLHVDECSQRAILDATAATRFAGNDLLGSTRSLGPLPILGIPGWVAANAMDTYYDDTRQFRPPRNSAVGGRSREIQSSGEVG
ncbi:MAG: DUF3025 domain-containing protein [Betaproteobacteria bacterium]|nr:DUF3025 domain-containing protein [Betaproteobacteria bacterium]